MSQAGGGNGPIPLDDFFASANAQLKKGEDHDPIAILDPLKWQDEPIPERRWIVPGWIPHGSVTMLNGDGGVGKSLLVLQLLIACALHRSWVGLSPQHYRCLGIFCEDDPDELHRRAADILKGYGADFGDLEDLLLVSRVGCENVMMVFDRAEIGTKTLVYADVLKQATDFGAQLVTLDTAADIFAGIENSRVQVRAFVNALRRIAMACDGALVLTAHPSLEGIRSGTGLSGSTAWHNSVRQRLYITRPEPDDEDDRPDSNARVLTSKKANYAGEGGEIPLRWEDGMLRFDGQEQHAGGMVDSIVTGNRQKWAEEAFLKCLAERNKQSRFVSQKPKAPNYAPGEFLKMDAAVGIKRRELIAAMERLFKTGAIIREDYGDRPSRTFERIITKEERLV